METKFPRTRRLVRLGARGRLVLPLDVRRHLRVADGDEVVMTLEADGGVHMTSREEVARRCLGMLKVPAGRDLVAELLEERRREVAAEDEQRS